MNGEYYFEKPDNMTTTKRLAFKLINDFSPSSEGKYSEHGSTRRARRAASRSSRPLPASGKKRWALTEFLCLFVTGVTLTSSTACCSGRDWCGAPWRGAVSSRGVSLSVCHGRNPDVIGMRQFWRDFCVNAQTWRGNFVTLLSSAFRKICRTKEKCLMQKCRRKRD